jgi:hypothetical protein
MAARRKTQYKVLIGLQEVNGASGFHRRQVDGALKRRQKALEYVAEVHKLADFVGGRVESLGLHEDWAISKEIFPEVQVLFLFNRANSQSPSQLKVFYSGESVRSVKSGDLTTVTIALLNHMLRFVKITNPSKDLPDICRRV